MSGNKISEMTNKELAEYRVPFFDTQDELMNFINALTDRQHDYNTVVEAMTLAALAAFNFVAGKLGATGFQASCADLNFIGKSRSINCPFMLVTLNEYLYPQYSTVLKINEWVEKNAKWIYEETSSKLKQDREFVSSEVWNHWEKLNKQYTPIV